MNYFFRFIHKKFYITLSFFLNKNQMGLNIGFIFSFNDIS